MDEYEIAIKKVLPFIHDTLGWPEKLRSEYGRVPVQMGGKIMWADFVCYISINQKPVPWIVFEVKTSGIPLEEALPQAESYGLLLHAPFFCVTDGEKFKFYKTGDAQGKSIPLKSLPPIPSEEYLKAGVEYISFPKEIDGLINLFIKGLKNEKKFFDDTTAHEQRIKELNEKVFKRIDEITLQEWEGLLKEKLKPIMIGKRWKREEKVFIQIKQDFEKFKRILKFIRDEFSGDDKSAGVLIVNINKMLDRNGDLHIKEGGIFFISQLLAGAYPDKYVILEDSILSALKQLGVIEILVKSDTGNAYVYINEICKKLFKEKMEHKLKENGFNFGLVAVHNFLWHYINYYINEGKWFP